MCKALIWLSATNRRRRAKDLYQEIGRIPGVRNVYPLGARYEDLEQIVIEITEDTQELNRIVDNNIDEFIEMILEKEEPKSPATVSVLISRYNTILAWIREKLFKIDPVRDVKIVEKIETI